MSLASFVRARTTPAPVPLVPEVRVHTADALTPVWEDVREVPFWCVPWAGGQALARHVLDHPDLVRGRVVLDVGAGSGLVAIAAALAGAARVTAVDVDPYAAAACEVNARLAGVALEPVVADPTTADPSTFALVDVILAGDVWYERDAASRFDALFRRLAGAGARVVTGDPGRAHVPHELVELARYEVPTTLELEGRTTKTTRILTYTPL